MVTAYTDGFPPRLNVAEHGDELQVIAGSEERLRARLAGKARQLSPRRAHREVHEPVGGAHDRQRRGGDGAVEGGAAGGEPAPSGGRKRPPQGGAERPGSSGADGEDDRGRPAGGAAGAGGGAADGGDGGGAGAGGRKTRRRPHTGGTRRTERD